MEFQDFITALKLSQAGSYGCPVFKPHQQQQQKQQPKQWIPRVDIKTTTDAYYIVAELPGIKKEDIEIDIKKDILTISGEKKESLFDSVISKESSTESIVSSERKEVQEEEEQASIEEDDFEDLDSKKTNSTCSTPTSSPSQVKLNSNNNNNEIETKSSGKYYQREINYGKFKKEFTLSTHDLDIESITAKHQDGTLLVTIPRIPEKKPVKINIF